MVKTPVFKGCCTAVVTPFNEQGVDYERYGKNLEYQYENGVSAIVVCGTTGENATLEANEREELVRYTVNHVRGRMKVIVGIGSNNTKSALQNAKSAKALGADAVLMVTPYYNKSTQAGLIRHFTFVADRVDIPMILYNVPSRTGIGITADTYYELSKHPNINGVKEASGDVALSGAMRSRCGDDLFLWSGNDDCTIPLMSLGALGVVSVASNILPGTVSKLCALCLENDFTGATELFRKYARLFAALFIETNPIPVKAAMKLLGSDSGILRLPLIEVTDEHLALLRNAMQETGMNI